MMICAKFGWNMPSGSGEEDENVKSLQTDGRTDRQTDVQQVIRKAHLSFQLRWAKNVIRYQIEYGLCLHVNKFVNNTTAWISLIDENLR